VKDDTMPGFTFFNPSFQPLSLSGAASRSAGYRIESPELANGGHRVVVRVYDSLGVADSVVKDVVVPNVRYVVEPLPGLGGNDALGAALNRSGDVVGWAVDGSGSMQPMLWRGGVATQLPLLTGSTRGFAHGINDAGVIVGANATSSPPLCQWVPLVWPSDRATATLASAGCATGIDINEAGHILRPATF
jgi:uncharacterized membrane protein